MDLTNSYNLILGGAVGLVTIGLSTIYYLKGKINKENKINANNEEKEEDNFNLIHDLEIENYPPANAIDQNFEDNNYPIIRCENCYEIPTIQFKMDKKEIQIKCEKEGKILDIPFKTFFDTLKKYKDINCCQFCKNKNPSQKYYLCNTCSNKILCQNCFDAHNKEDDLIKLKIDSTCKKHNNPYESYCPICKESKCSYCSIDHNKSHEKEEIPLKKKLLKKDELDAFKNTINKIKNDKQKIEEKINSVTKELEKKIELIKNLKNKFSESLNMKLQFVELLLNNYEKKMEEFDINYSIINNLESQMNLGLLNLVFKDDDSLDKKINNINKFINNNINLQFNCENKKANKKKEKSEIVLEAEYFENITTFNYNSQLTGFLDFNKDLFVLYFSDSIFFISKNDYKTIFNIKEFELNDIKTCRKINGEKILAYTSGGIIIIKIINNSDYMIDKKISTFYKIYDFNSHLDLLYLHIGNNNFYNYEDSSLRFLTFPNYNSDKFIKYVKRENYIENNKLQFNGDNSFFHFAYNNLQLYSITNSNCSLVNKVKISLDLRNASIVDLNNDYYYLYTKNIILLLKKTDLTIVKTFNIDYNNLGISILSDKQVALFLNKKDKFVADIYDILSNGIKLEVNKEKEILKGNVINLFQSNDYILFMKKYNREEKTYNCVLFHIKNE